MTDQEPYKVPETFWEGFRSIFRDCLPELKPVAPALGKAVGAMVLVWGFAAAVGAVVWLIL
jgi:hypothetical protein